MQIISSKPSKQRLFQLEAPLHIKRKMLSSTLSKELRKELGKRSFPLRKNDTVKIMRGKFKGKTGKITEVNYQKGTVFIEKITRKKSDGTEVFIPIHASNLMITELYKEDEKRFKRIKLKKEKKKEKIKEKKKKEKKIEEKELA